MPFQIRTMGIYRVVDTTNGLILMWDGKTSIFIKLSPSFQVRFKIQTPDKIISCYLSKKKMEIQAVTGRLQEQQLHIIILVVLT